MRVGGQRHAPAALPPGKETRYPLYRRLGGPQGRSGRLRKISPPPGIDPRTVQPVASRYTNCAIPAQYNRYFCQITRKTKGHNCCRYCPTVSTRPMLSFRIPLFFLSAFSQFLPIEILTSIIKHILALLPRIIVSDLF
jgi:hypothetical protein